MITTKGVKARRAKRKVAGKVVHLRSHLRTTTTSRSKGGLLGAVARFERDFSRESNGGTFPDYSDSDLRGVQSALRTFADQISGEMRRREYPDFVVPSKSEE